MEKIAKMYDSNKSIREFARTVAKEAESPLEFVDKPDVAASEVKRMKRMSYMSRKNLGYLLRERQASFHIAMAGEVGFNPEIRHLVEVALDKWIATDPKDNALREFTQRQLDPMYHSKEMTRLSALPPLEVWKEHVNGLERVAKCGEEHASQEAEQPDHSLSS